MYALCILDKGRHPYFSSELQQKINGWVHVRTFYYWSGLFKFIILFCRLKAETGSAEEQPARNKAGD
jgi:hypothetical protein